MRFKKLSLHTASIVIIIIAFSSCYISEATNQKSWYKGDLHSHSLHSDGDSPVDHVIATAENLKFDFFVITDHNTNSQWHDPAYKSDKFTLLYGVEWTTQGGHANIWSNEPFDWDIIESTLKNKDVSSAIDLVHSFRNDEQEILFSINHPFSILCFWSFSIEDSIKADCLEAWNAPWSWPNMNFRTVKNMFHKLSLKRKKISLVGGSDVHHLSPDNILGTLENMYYTMGTPTTYVYANSNNGKDILSGIRSGNVFISHSPKGPKMQLQADADDNMGNEMKDEKYEIMMGDSIPLSLLGKKVNFRIKVSNARTSNTIVGFSHLLIIKNGKIFKMKVYSKENYIFEFTDIPEEGDYYRSELRMITFDHNKKIEEYVQIDNVVTITNAIYTW